MQSWLNGLAAAAKKELASLLTSKEVGLAGDWIEDHGGQREWAERLMWGDWAKAQFITVRKALNLARQKLKRYEPGPWDPDIVIRCDRGYVVSVPAKAVGGGVLIGVFDLELRASVSGETIRKYKA